MPNMLSNLWALMQPSDAQPLELPKAMPTPPQVNLTPFPKKPTVNDRGVPSALDPSPFFLANQQPAMEPPPTNDLPMPIPAAPLAPPPQMGATYHQPTHQQSDDEKAINDTFKKMLADRESRIQDYRNREGKLGDRPTGFQALDLSPLAAYVDSTTGSDLSKGYHGPRALQDYDAQKKMLQAAIDKEQNGLSDDQMKYLQVMGQERARMDANDARREQNSLLAGLKQQGMALREDNLIARNAGAFDKDSLVTDYRKGQDIMSRDYHTIAAAPIITNSQLKELTNGIANALQGAGRSSESDRTKQEMATAAASAAGWAQYITGKPQDAATPEIRKYIVDQIKRLHEAFGMNIDRRVGELQQGRQSSSARVNQQMQSKVDALKKQAAAPLGQGYADASPAIGSAPMSTQNPDVVAKMKRLQELQAKANGG